MASPGVLAAFIIGIILVIALLIIWFVLAIKFPAVATAWRKVFDPSILAA